MSKSRVVIIRAAGTFDPGSPAERSRLTRMFERGFSLLADGATIPFIARYRKERTGEMNEVRLRALNDRFAYLTDFSSIPDESKALLGDLDDLILDALRHTPHLRSDDSLAGRLQLRHW